MVAGLIVTSWRSMHRANPSRRRISQRTLLASFSLVMGLVSLLWNQSSMLARSSVRLTPHRTVSLVLCSVQITARNGVPGYQKSLNRYRQLAGMKLR